MENKEVNILDYFILIYKSRKFILFNFIIVCLIAVIISLILPKYYKASAVLLPPSDTQEGFGLSQMLSALPVNIRLGSQGSPSDIFIGILKSQTVGNEIIKKFDLVTVYKAEDIDRAREQLSGLTKFSLSKEGLLEINVQDKDPKRAAEMANIYCATLDSVNKFINREASKQRADFLRRQLTDNETALKNTEMELRDFQQKTRSISPFQMQKIALTLSAQLEMEILKSKNLLNKYKSKSLTNNHPLVKELSDNIRIMSQQLNDLRFGNNNNSESTESLLMPLKEIPDVALDYEKLTGRIEVLGQLGQLLKQQYEESRLQQMNTASTINILDKASVPLHKYRPKRALIVIIAGAASLLFSLVAVMTIEFLNRYMESDSENRRKIERLTQVLHIKA
jgi:tyrosine-protein kinase Etk/Wzc